MSLVEDILGKVLEKAGVGGSEGGSDNPLMSILLPLLLSMLGGGGLSSILDKMRAQGLTAEADSWVSTGTNLPITADQARSVVGADQISELAGRLGISEDQTAGLLAEALPQVVDRVSPAGELPDQADVDDAIGAPERRRGRRRR